VIDPPELWKRYRQYLCRVDSLDLALDISRMHFNETFLASMEPKVQHAFSDMDALESGAIANPDEKRMVGHYWLRAPQLAPTKEIAREIAGTVESIKKFVADVHSGKTKPPSAPRFTQVLAIGIGGSALGPMFVGDALSNPPADRVAMHFIDNTDPEGIARMLQTLKGLLRETLCIVTSKSGGTPDTRNGMVIVADEYRATGLDFSRHFVAITMPGSRLDKLASSENWLARFPMFDWVGGRTSELSAVGLLPAALQGIDIDAMLAGAAACDAATRVHETRRNPAALMALMWYVATDGRGKKDLVVLPYKDRLLLFSRYLQQLVMESLGKQLGLDGRRVEQGIAVYGNKGSTDQHAFVQQLRDGVNNFFVTFVRVLESGGKPLEVEPSVTAGDYLHGFLIGTREALYGNDRQSMTITIPRVDARIVGALIALFERAVGLYASLIHINAYNQPGVEAGKKAAAAVLNLQAKALAALSSAPQTADQVAAAIGAAQSAETIHLVLEHLSSNGRAKLARAADPGATTFTRV
jgi:glucose-6-phosphate isomerase